MSAETVECFVIWLPCMVLFFLSFRYIAMRRIDKQHSGQRARIFGAEAPQRAEPNVPDKAVDDADLGSPPTDNAFQASSRPAPGVEPEPVPEVENAVAPDRPVRVRDTGSGASPHPASASDMAALRQPDSAGQQQQLGRPVALLPLPRLKIGEVVQFVLPEWHERAAACHGRLLIVTHISADGEHVDGYIVPAEKHARVTIYRNVMASDVRTTGGRAIEVLDLEQLRQPSNYKYRLDEEAWLNAGEVYKNHRARTSSLI